MAYGERGLAILDRAILRRRGRLLGRCRLVNVRRGQDQAHQLGKTGLGAVLFLSLPGGTVQLAIENGSRIW